MPLQPGDTVCDRYRIIRQLGQGGFATIYQAEDVQLKSLCALKENQDYWGGSQRQFEREAKILSKLDHSNLPHVLDYFVLPGEGQYMVMEFVQGLDLQELLNQANQPLSEYRALDWVAQICDALIYLHTYNPPVIHRDVKPANIKINESGKAILVDFGVAKTYDPSEKTTLAARAVTPGYSPIEQYGHGSTDARSDQYALAATLYTLLTNQRPPESIERVTGQTLTPPREWNPNISPHVEEAILRGMEILAAKRFESMAGFKKALRQRALQDSVHLGLRPKRLGGGAIDSGAEIALNIRRSGSRYGMQFGSLEDRVKVEWMKVPEGDFPFGEDQKIIRLPTFEISRYPVTNLQYFQYLQANPQQPAPKYWVGREFTSGNEDHPVIGVDFQDALAFCAWSGCRLPSEQEWEKAGRGIDGRPYPWGDAWVKGLYCNNWEANIGGTTPVDRYPMGVSPYGVWDMAGNVWEWTNTPYQGPFMHVLRGGSWREFGSFAVKLTARSCAFLEEMRDDLGFRLARTV